MENTGGGFDDVPVGGDRRDLDHAMAEVAIQLNHATGGAEWLRGRAQDTVVGALARAVDIGEAGLCELWLTGIERKAIARDRDRIVVQEAVTQKLANHIGETARGVEMVHVGKTVWINLGH